METDDAYLSLVDCEHRRSLAHLTRATIYLRLGLPLHWLGSSIKSLRCQLRAVELALLLRGDFHGVH